MESFKCKFCFKSFFNGKALSGHMRSHHIPSLHNFSFQEEEERESYVSSYSSSEDGFASKNVLNNTRKRSKRTRKLDSFKKIKKMSHQEPSAFDTTTEEDLAFCLMMLSRDQWKRKKKEEEEIELETEETSSSSEEEGYKKQRYYKCETCGKVFKSYQALGGHRASHKKNKVCYNDDNVVVGIGIEKRIHECPICFRVFASGQALGGHKRSHGMGHHHHGHGHEVVNRREYVKERMIDLNLPAPKEEEEEVSMVFQ